MHSVHRLKLADIKVIGALGDSLTVSYGWWKEGQEKRRSWLIGESHFEPLELPSSMQPQSLSTPLLLLLLLLLLSRFSRVRLCATP